MNPWDTLNKLLSNKPLTDEDKTCPVVLLLRVLSFDNQLIRKVDKLNYFYPLTNEEWYNLLQVCFGCSGYRYIKYIKKSSDKECTPFEKFRMRVKELFSWSDREFGINLPTIIRNLNSNFLSRIGLSDKEQKELPKFMLK